MKNTLEQLKDKLSNTTGEEKLDALLEISMALRKQFDPLAIEYIHDGLELAEALNSYRKKALLYQEEYYMLITAQKMEQSIECAKRMLALCDENGDKELRITALRHIGGAYEVDLDKSSYWYEKALKEAQQINYVKEEIRLHNTLGFIKERQMLFDEATAYCLKALALAQELKDDELIGSSYFNLGSITKDERSIEYLKKAVELFEQMDHIFYWQACLQLGWAYKENGYFDNAHNAVDKCIRIVEENKARTKLVMAYHTKADLLISQSKQEEPINKTLIKEAEKIINKAIGFIEKGDANRINWFIFLQKVEIDYHLGAYQEALKTLDTCFQESQLITDSDAYRSYKELYWKVYDALNDVENAYRSYKEFVELDNKYKYSKSLKESKSLEAKFAAKEKETEVKRLQEVEELKTRFFSQVTHELRTPLSLILGPARQIPKIPDRNEINQQAVIIERNANRLLELVNQLLDVNKLEAGKMQLKKSFGDFSAFMETLIQAFQTLATSKQIQLDFINDFEELIVNFDSDKIEKILYNLLSNAFKFTDAGGQILCHLTALPSENIEQNWVQISLADSGKGIAKNDLPHIFDRFYQADNSLTRGAEGTGIGLALVKELVELMDGKIEVESVLSKGTSFAISLPLELGNASEIEQDEHRLEAYYEPRASDTFSKVENLKQPSRNVPVLLLIEDNPDMHSYISSILGQEYILLQANNGQLGIDLAIERIPDIILSDVMMPEKDGYQVCEELKEDVRTSHIPIVLLTAKAALKSRIEGLEHGADAYLTKPFSAEELKLQLKNLLKTQSNLQKKYSQFDTNNPSTKSLNKEELFLKKVRDIIDENIGEESLNVEKLSQLMLMSSSQLYRKIQALTHFSTSKFIRDIRLAKGKVLLETKQGNVSEVAYKIGLEPAYFSKCFVKKYGILPRTLL